ncbi:hypothetical protein ABKV19_006996 [Rosa sericea]
MEEIRTSEQSKPLYQSLRDGDVLEVVKAYAKATTLDARLELIPTVHDDTILHMAIYMEQESIAIGIIEISGHNDDLITERNAFGNTALHEAAATDCVRVVEKLLEKAPALLSIPNKKGEMPLYTAAHFGQKKNFILLAEKLKNNHCDLRPHLCSLSPSYKSVEELKEHSYGPEHIRSTILHAAIHAEFFELALLIARKPEYAKIVRLEDKNLKTPLQLLSSNSSAFESGMKCGLIKRFIHNCAPYEDAKKEDAHEQNSSDDSHVQSSKRSVFSSAKRSATQFLRQVFSSVNRSVWIVLRAWSTMRSIYDEKKRHGLALELATFLIAADFSWDVTRLALKNESMMQTAVGLPFPDSEDSGGFSITSTEDPSAPSLEKSTPPAIPLHIATEHGILEIVKETLRVHPAAYEYRNTKEQNILHLSIMHRQRDIFDLVMKKETPKSRLQRQLDINDFTVLHQVGNIEHYNGGTQPGPALQLQEELEWFEKVEGLIPLHYEKFSACEAGKDTTLQSFHRRYVEILKDLSENIEVDKIITPDSHKEEKKKETPIEYFRRTHDPLLQSAQEWLKRTSESCSTVAGLMATVAFAAAFTLPGGNDENSGTPLLLHSPFFLVFIITDALSLASSLTSLVMFLSILTSPFEIDDFRHSLPRKLILGFTFLFISVAVTMLAFASTLMLTIPMKKRVTKSFVYCVAFLPVTMFALLQFPLLLAFKKSLKYPVMAMKSVWRLLISASILKSDKTQ